MYMRIVYWKVTLNNIPFFIRIFEKLISISSLSSKDLNI